MAKDLRDAIKLGQSMLNAWDSSVRVDGVMGPATRRSFGAAPASLQDAIEESVMKWEGVSFRRIVESSAPGKGKPIPSPSRRPDILLVSSPTRDAPKEVVRARVDSDWLTLDELMPVFRRAVSGLSVATVAMLVNKARFEPTKETRGGVTRYWTRSVNGSFRGLFQMGRKAWADATTIDRSIPGFDGAAYDPYWNSRAAACYIDWSAGQLRKLGYKGPINEKVLYGAHQQGAAGFIRFLESGEVKGNQSRESVKYLTELRTELKTASA